MIYLDNAATTKISPSVFNSMIPYLKEEFGNAGSSYELGRKAHNAIAQARQQVANCVGAKPEQIVFTSGGTEANNLALKGVVSYLKSQNKTHLVASAIEHDSVLNTIKEMNIKDGFDVTYLGVNDRGNILLNELEDKIREDTGLCSVMYVNNEIGSVNDVVSLSQVAHKKGALFHTDCVQALGDFEIDVKVINCDFLSISSHKIHGAKGVGALYIKNKEIISPLINGGLGQEFGVRGGTENVAGIVGFGTACDLLNKNFQINSKRIAQLKVIFYETLCNELNDGRTIYFYNGNSPYNKGKTLSICFRGVDAQSLVLYLDTKQIYVSSGSACRNHSSEPNKTLLAIGLSEEDAQSTIRVSFTHYLTESQIVYAAKTLAEAVKALKGMRD